MNIVCKFASNLACDLEYFATLSIETPLKCDFDFKKYIIYSAFFFSFINKTNNLKIKKKKKKQFSGHSNIAID